MTDASTPRTRTRAFLRGSLLVGLVLGAGLALYLPYLDLFIFTEARQYVHYRGGVEDLVRHLGTFLVPVGWNNRPASMLAFRAMHGGCGYDWRCLNAVQIGLVLAAAVLLLCHGAQVLRSQALAAALALVWLASLPVLDAVTWQATSHDKLAAVFTLGVLVLLHWACAAPHSRRVVTGASTVLAVLTAIALNAKESAFFLPLLLPLAAVLWGVPRKREGLLQAALVVLPATAFSAYYVALYLIRLDASWAAHVLSAGSTWNVRVLGAYLNAALQPAAWHAAAFLAAGGALALVLRRHARGAGSVLSALARPEVQATLYFACFFAGAALLAVKTRFPGPYYMYIPGIGWYGLLAALGQALGRERHAVLRGVGVLAIGLLCVDLVASVRHQTSDATRHARLLAASRRLSRKLPALRERLPPDPGLVYTLVVPQDVKCFFHFLRSGSGDIDPTLLNFLYGTDGDYSVRQIAPRRFRRSAIESHERVLVLDGTCAIEAAFEGRRRVL